MKYPIQGKGHVEFEDSFRCAIYIDDNSRLYGTAELIPLNELVAIHGNYIFI